VRGSAGAEGLGRGGLPAEGGGAALDLQQPVAAEEVRDAADFRWLRVHVEADFLHMIGGVGNERLEEIRSEHTSVFRAVFQVDVFDVDHTDKGDGEYAENPNARGGMATAGVDTMMSLRSSKAGCAGV